MKVRASMEVLETLKESLKREGKDAVRFEVTGFGWAGPKFDIVLDEQKEKDSVYEAEGVKFVAEEEISFLIDGLELVLAGGRVKIKASGCC